MSRKSRKSAQIIQDEFIRENGLDGGSEELSRLKPVQIVSKHIDHIPVENGLVVPVKFEVGVLNIYEFVALQTIIEQAVMVIRGNLSPFDSVRSSSEYTIKGDEGGNISSVRLGITVDIGRSSDFFTRDPASPEAQIHDVHTVLFENEDKPDPLTGKAERSD